MATKKNPPKVKTEADPYAQMFDGVVQGDLEYRPGITHRQAVASAAQSGVARHVQLFIEGVPGPFTPELSEFTDALCQVQAVMCASFGDAPDGTFSGLVIWMAKELQRKRTYLFAAACAKTAEAVEQVAPRLAEPEIKAYCLHLCSGPALVARTLDPESTLLKPEQVLKELARSHVKIETRIGNLARLANAMECGGLSSMSASDRFRRALKTVAQQKK